MLRHTIAVAVVLVALAFILVGYSILFIGTGLPGAFSLLSRYWRDVISGPGKTQNFQWLAVIVAALLLGWRAGYMRESGRYLGYRINLTFIDSFQLRASGTYCYRIGLISRICLLRYFVLADVDNPPTIEAFACTEVLT